MLFHTIKQSTEYKKLIATLDDKPSVVALFGLPPVARAQFMAMVCKQTNRPVLVICNSEGEATRFCDNAKQFGAQSEVYPARDFVFRNIEGQNHEYETRRLSVLGNIVGKRTNMVCAPIEAVLQYTVPKQQFCDNTLTLKKGMQIKQSDLLNKLVSAGYLSRGQVEGPGQFSHRGSIIDIYAPDMVKPCRIELWGDEIDTIHTFDIITQRRDAKLNKIYLSPAREVLFSDAHEGAQILKAKIEQCNVDKDKKALEEALRHDIQLLENNIMPVSMDKYLHIRYEKAGLLPEYFEDPIIFLNEYSAIKDAVNSHNTRFAQEIETLLQEGVLCKHLIGFYNEQGLFLHKVEKNGVIVCESFMRSTHDFKLKEIISAPSHSIPPWSGEIKTLLEEVQPLIRQNYCVAILCGTKRAANALAKDLRAENLNAAVYKIGDANDVPYGSVAVFEGHLTTGVHYPFAKLAIFTSRRHTDESSKKPVKSKNKGLSSLSDITQGDFVVHQNHGIGQYVGVQRLDMQGVVKDYLKITYNKGDTLYVPVTQLDIVSKYTAPGDSDKVKLSKLGGEAWTKTKSRVKAATAEMAKELIELYAKREKAQGHAFAQDNEWQRDFELRFAYDETDDQIRSAQEIKKDMQKPTPMDRLLCGDVGVGKTEVALRAAFKCIMDGKQCAILVPTTILAWQHYNSIISRMESFPIKVALLSRFRTSLQIKNSIKGLNDGTVDIVVGTHRLIQKDIKFKNLGLVIVDEEQRFGVKHKERLKEMFVGVDMLTLSATPIPRTLNMALSGLRDMSTIETPPIERRPVETYVLEYDDILIADAIKKELGRGGQVYYLHNRVETIENCAIKLNNMVPEAKIGIAHGKMDEASLSSIWQKLVDGEIDILVCTTLIETGVDVRNCNTLIIENADYMGLAQLYQLRGRVGRSGRKAYAYFTFRRDKVLTDVASKRLSAIREFTSFGSGFRIAMRDLQIRGAGNLLGQSQHGHMESVGYDMYVKLLNSAIKEQKGEINVKDKSECLVDISEDAYIPHEYIQQQSARIEAYKRIAAIESKIDAEDVKDELTDRYGKIPKSALGLILISVIRVAATKLGIYEITQKGDTLIMYSDMIDVQKIKPLLKQMKGMLLLNASTKPYLSLKVEQPQNSMKCLEEFLEKLEQIYTENL